MEALRPRLAHQYGKDEVHQQRADQQKQLHSSSAVAISIRLQWHLLRDNNMRHLRQQMLQGRCYRDRVDVCSSDESCEHFFGATCDDGVWRLKIKADLQNVYDDADQGADNIQN